MHHKRITQLKPLSRRMATMSSIVLVAVSSSAIADDYQTTERPGQPGAQSQSQQRYQPDRDYSSREERQYQQQWQPSEARESYSEEYQPSWREQGSSYDREGSGRIGLRLRASQLSQQQREELFEGVRESGREQLGRMSQEEKEELLENVKEAARDWMQERRERFAQLSQGEREELLEDLKETARNRTQNIREQSGESPQEQSEQLVEAVTQASRDWTQNLRERVGELPPEQSERLRERIREAARDSLSERQEEFALEEDQPRRFGERFQRAGRSMQQRRTGEVKAIGIVKLQGMSQSHVIVNIKSEEGRRFIADLGPVNKLNQVEISPGARITVVGIRGRLNERPIILARQVRSDDGRFQVLDWQQARGQLRRHIGEIVSTRVQHLRDGVPRLLARVCLDDGREITVDLGPQQDLRQVGLRSGKQISILGRPARIDGREALVAEEFRTDGQTIYVEDLERRERFPLRGQPIGDEFEQQRWEQPRDRQQDEFMSSTRPAGRTIEIYARGYEFQPSQISVQPGQRVRVRLINRGATEHSIAFQLPQGEARLESPLAAGEVDVLEFMAPQRPGTYSFYCPDHRGLGMEGRLVVQSSQQQQSQQQQSQQERQQESQQELQRQRSQQDESQRQQSQEQQQQEPRY